MYLNRFCLPEDEHGVFWDYYLATLYNGNTYPFNIFPQKDLHEIRCANITVLYGSNGSGKSTLLNLIADSLSLKRTAPFNTSEVFALYASACTPVMGTDEQGDAYRVPNGSRIITSDDIFDYMLSARTENERRGEAKEAAGSAWAGIRYGVFILLLIFLRVLIVFIVITRACVKSSC